jgi:hypothetical protein
MSKHIKRKSLRARLVDTFIRPFIPEVVIPDLSDSVVECGYKGDYFQLRFLNRKKRR